MCKTTLLQFYFALQHHDWNYQYSDDFSVWKCGSGQRYTLEQIALESDQHMKLYREFYDFMKGKCPRPELPKED